MVKSSLPVVLLSLLFFVLGSFALAEDDTTTTTTTATTTTDVTTSPMETPSWPPATRNGATVRDLHNEYNTIFKHGNRNAASHRWSTFLLDRSSQMTIDRLEYFFGGFCAVSGSPVRSSDYNRYRLNLPLVGTGHHALGYMHYCCWPCVCDTQDFIRIDTLNVTTTTMTTTTKDLPSDDETDGTRAAADSEATTTTQQRFFAVIGNPCDHPEKLHQPFHQPFYGGRTTTLAETAQEIRCLQDGTLEGATLSDHGFVIISMFFDAKVVDTNDSMVVAATSSQPGRITTFTDPIDGTTVMFQDEREFGPRCEDRAADGYNSGMGEIFRKVSAISPIPQQLPDLSPDVDEPSCDASEDASSTDRDSAEPETPAATAES